MTKIHIGDTKGMPAPAVALIRESSRAIARGDIKAAEKSLTLAMVYSPQHPETLRLLGLTQMQQGRHGDAAKNLRIALLSRPDDPDLLLPLAQCEAYNNDVASAIGILRKLVSQRDDAETLYNLAEMLDRHGAVDEALSVAERVVHKNPSHAFARILFARCLVAGGRLDEAASQYRRLIDTKQEVAKAWYGLAEIKTLKLTASELSALKDFSRRKTLSYRDHVAVLHALGKGLEDAGDYAAAYAAFEDAGHLLCEEGLWDAGAFHIHMEQTRTAFVNSVRSADTQMGSEVIFIVGLPRSGSTLVEQILSAHPEVEGASELPDLNAIIQEESTRRRTPFPNWVPQASAADWERMGQTYLSRTARWRERSPKATDKLPENWMLAEAALHMLPGAIVIDCRRDAVETCWSCFKQVFAPGRVTWSYSFADLASYWKECRSYMDYLKQRYPDSVRIQRYEALVEDTESQIRDLLKFCRLRFETECLRYYDASRSIRTASAAQVRQPIRKDTALADEYGPLLDPLRTLLAQARQELRGPT